MTLRVLDLFSGIGGFSLGLERTGGFETVAFCEIDPFCQRVLAKHWPKVPCYDDVRTLNADALARDGISVEVICGGFPCQDVSHAGKRAGLEGARSGLWGEYARLIGELRPHYVIVENVPGLLSLGMGDVLGDLAAIGYDAFWDCISASAIGAPHIRDRVWIVAQPQYSNANDAGPYRAPLNVKRDAELRDEQERQPRPLGEDVANTAAGGLAQGGDGRANRARGATKARTSARRPFLPNDRSGHQSVADADGARLDVRQRIEAGSECTGLAAIIERGGWNVEPNVGRVAHGVPARVDRIGSLGNAVVPQIPELIGHAVLASMRCSTPAPAPPESTPGEP